MPHQLQDRRARTNQNGPMDAGSSQTGSHQTHSGGRGPRSTTWPTGLVTWSTGRVLAGAVTGLAAGLVLLIALPVFASAGFSATIRATATVRSAADWTPPTVSVASPGGTVKDTVTLTASAADGESGIREVVIQHHPPNGTGWVTLCTVASSPYSCAWNTRAVANGTHVLRARATDHAGYATTSGTVTTVVANSVVVVLGDPGDVVRGTVSLPVTIHNPPLLVTSVSVEHAVAGSGTWKPVCTKLTSPYTCSWTSTTVANDSYDLRAVVVSGTSTWTSAVRTDVLVDNLAPTVTMTDPGSPLRGTVTLTTVPTDTHSGVASVRIQRSPNGGSTWTDTCTVTSAPHSCRFDTTTIADGTWAFRAIATDVAGNATTSAAVTGRVVDNTVSSVSLEDPGAYLTGTVALRASANSTAGVDRVVVQRAPAGTTTWTDVCTVTTSPYTCAWNTTTVADGLHDLRALLVDGLGRQTISAVVVGRRVDNSPLRGLDLQAANGGGTAGRMDAGDTLTLTFSRQVRPATVTSGWTGAAQAVSVRVRDGNTLGLGNRGDTLDVQLVGSVVNLGSVNLQDDYVKTGKTVVLNATMTAGTVTTDGVVRSTITLLLGTVGSGANDVRSALTAAHMAWTPSAAVLDANGNACSTAPVTETGTPDKEF